MPRERGSRRRGRLLDFDVVTDEVASVLNTLHYVSILYPDKCLPFLRIWQEFYLVFGDSRDQARRRLYRWRGMVEVDAGEHPDAWITKVGNDAYQVTNSALIKVGEGREVTRRKLRKDPDWEHLEEARAEAARKRAKQLDNEVPRLIGKEFATGASIADIKKLMTRINRRSGKRAATIEAAKVLASRLVHAGKLVRLARGLYGAGEGI